MEWMTINHESRVHLTHSHTHTINYTHLWYIDIHMFIKKRTCILSTIFRCTEFKTTCVLHCFCTFRIIYNYIIYTLHLRSSSWTSAMVAGARRRDWDGFVWRDIFVETVETTWWFPEIGLPLVPIHFHGMFHEINHLFWGTPMNGNHHMGSWGFHRDVITVKMGMWMEIFDTLSLAMCGPWK